MGSLSLEDDEVEVGSALSLDDEPTLSQGSVIYVIALDADSPYLNPPASELQGMVMTWTVIGVNDIYEPGSTTRRREITVKQEGLIPTP